MTHPLTARWAAGETTFGVWGTIDSAFAAELIAAEGPDYFCCDQQHGLIGLDTLVSMLQAVHGSGCVAVARVPNHDPALIGQALDAGAAGVIVPMVSTPAEAAQLVRAFRYQPDGVRSYGPARAALTLGSKRPGPLSEVACILMIETASALQHVEEIAALPGVDALFVGPADLALALGSTPGGADEPVLREALTRVVDACRRHGVTPGIQCRDGASARRHQELGFRMITVATDASVLQRAVRDELAVARAG
jgi:4-hydroxy-2-oxoheptanedioate aldolase